MQFKIIHFALKRTNIFQATILLLLVMLDALKGVFMSEAESCTANSQAQR